MATVIGGLLTGMSCSKPDFAALLWCVRDKDRTFSNPFANINVLNIQWVNTFIAVSLSSFLSVKEGSALKLYRHEKRERFNVAFGRAPTGKLLF